MTVKWRYVNKKASYRVVQAGNSIRLYRNNVLHSQWNDMKPVSGKLWDLFLITVVGQRKSLSNVLVLGAGGGSVINLIHYFYPDANITAVDFDRVHLKVAKKYFKVNTKKCELIYSDAQKWIKNNGKNKFDLIVDDVFSELDSIPYRSIDDQSDWAKLLVRQLKSKGVLVFNFADKQEWNRNYKLWNVTLSHYNIAVTSHSKCDNKIVHISKHKLSRKNLISSLNKSGHTEYVKYVKNGTFSYRAMSR